MRYKHAPVRLYGQVPRMYTERLDITGVPGSWMAPIGGILANVRPKHRGEIWLDDDPKYDDERGQLHVHGRVEPAIGEQRMTVYATEPDRSTMAVIAYTEANGRFRATFQLGRRRKAVLRGKERPVLSAEPGLYAFQAHILAAKQIAPADSNVVWYQIGDGGREQKPDEGQYQKRPTPLDLIDRGEKTEEKKG